ncbi:hypothetical protein BJV82DRAFT_619572 [Fennellomyces sp. T-0311]|nr:hypothetical protein BJV82DRAFT_619572 [Fennellomyces sp. T-0311]
MRRFHRAIGGLSLLVLVGLVVSVTVIPRIQQHQEQVSLSHWMSTAYNTNSSLQLAPTPTPSPPREKFLSYSPHGDFLEQHEALRMAVRLAYETNRTVDAPALRLESGNNTWVQIPWSKLFDFGPLEQEFGIRIVDRTQVPTEYERVEISRTSRTTTPNSWFSLQWFKTPPPPPLVKRVFTLKDLKQLASPYLQCNALGTWMFRKALDAKEQQQYLNMALISTMLTRPDQLQPLTAAASAVVHELGGIGQFSGLTVHLDRMVPPVQFLEDDTVVDRRSEAMSDVVLELFTGMPINQAVAAALPIQPSALRDYMQSGQLDRRRLLEACVDYRRNVDTRFPVVYMVINDHEPMEPSEHPEILKPLLEFFPCVFYKSDMYEWGVIDASWAIESRWALSVESNVTTMPMVDYEALLSPLLNLLIAGQGYSFFEVPPSPLTHAVSRQLVDLEK